MKNLFSILALLFLTLIFVGCSEDDEEPNEVGGETNIAINQVGNEFSTSVNVGGVYADLNETIKVVANDNGFVSIDVSADLSSPALAAINDMIPASMKDQTGKINTQVALKITSEGIQDFFNKDQKPHTMVKYDCNVGDNYTITKSDGKTITRTVTAKSDQDDFPYGFMYIKTITVTQDSRIPGVSHFEYRFNHKFGLVHVKMVFEDGTNASSYVMTQNS